MAVGRPRRIGPSGASGLRTWSKIGCKSRTRKVSSTPTSRQQQHARQPFQRDTAARSASGAESSSCRLARLPRRQVSRTRSGRVQTSIQVLYLGQLASGAYLRRSIGLPAGKALASHCYHYPVTPRTGIPRDLATVFLDRDGVLNQKMPEGQYVTPSDDFHILPGVPEAIARLNQAGLRVLVVSNQRGIALGLYTAADVDAIHAAFQQQL